MQNNKLIKVGVIKSPHGIKGDCIIKSFTEISDNFFKYDLVDDSGNEIKIKKIKIKSTGDYICRIEGVSDRNDTELLKGKFIFTDRKCFAEAKDGEYYYEDIKNIPVYDLDNNEIGIVNDILNYGAGDILEVKLKDSEECELYPFTNEIFPTIDKDKLIIDINKYKL